ncbi:hypothetical protein MWH25_10115 [Natroniella acetigena]|uniref:hypothetical protein n=1 Tax=Natroniella acetigena TaxID=52004 RepID=UPI00200B5C25|nr:hypothetical protein [Natroniella acetigena]MCK8828085.1 hypothetical protein [Natroniella acetigena]
MKKEYKKPTVFDFNLVEMAAPAALVPGLAAVAKVAGVVVGAKAVKAAMEDFNYNLKQQLIVRDNT